MTFLIVQITVCLVIASLLGMAIGWMLNSAITRPTRQATREELSTKSAALDQAHIDLRAANSRVRSAEDALSELDAAPPVDDQRLARIAKERDEARHEAEALADANRALLEELQRQSAPRDPDPVLEDDPTAPLTLMELHDEAPETPDDLKRIKGIGPATERRLNAIGVYRLQQLADLEPLGINWLERRLEIVSGRIRREEWIAQAKALTASTNG